MRCAAEGPVTCDDPERYDQWYQHAARCYVNHSSNTIPAFTCPPQSALETTDEVYSEVHASKCAYDKTVYNITTFVVNNTGKQLTCTVRYTAVGDSSVVYSEEHFVVFHDSVKLQSDMDITKKELQQNEESGKQNTLKFFTCIDEINIKRI